VSTPRKKLTPAQRKRKNLLEGVIRKNLDAVKKTEDAITELQKLKAELEPAK
jgi:hypothetical protein